MGSLGRPLYLQYRPSALVRGKPADSLVWQAADRFGEATGVARINIDIECSPGYFYEESAPTHCLPCPAGQYNLPNAQDQVLGTAFCVRCFCS